MQVRCVAPLCSDQKKRSPWASGIRSISRSSSRVISPRSVRYAVPELASLAHTQAPRTRQYSHMGVRDLSRLDPASATDKQPDHVFLLMSCISKLLVAIIKYCITFSMRRCSSCPSGATQVSSLQSPSPFAMLNRDMLSRSDKMQCWDSSCLS